MILSKKHIENSLQIGRRVKKLRKRAGLSLDQLSRLSGVSKAMLSQIEQNKANPTVAVIYKITKALNANITEIMDSATKKPRFQVIRKEDERYTFLSSEKCTIRTLSPLSLEKDIEFYQIDLKPEGSLDSEPHFQNTEEILAVVKGKIKVQSAEKSVTLTAGDSVYYSADVNHSIKNVGTTAAKVYLVVKYRTE